MMNNIKITVILQFCFLMLNMNFIFGQVVKIDFPEGKIFIESANLNIVGYDGTQVIAEMMYEQNRPDLQAGLTKINSLKSEDYYREEIEYKIKGKELHFDTGRSGRLSLKVPRNLKIVCQSQGKNYYYYDGLKLIKIDGVDGEIEISANTGVDIDIKNCSGSMSVVSYGNITVAMNQLPSTGLLSFDTYLGYVNLSLPIAAAANLELRSKKGDIFTNLPIDKKPNKTNAKKVITTLGGGGIDIIINAEAGGDIYLRKKEEE